MKHLYFITILSLAIAFGVSTQTFAISPDKPRIGLKQATPSAKKRLETIESRQEELDEKKDEIIQKRCEIVKQNVQNRIQIHERKREKYQKHYQNVVQKTQSLVARLKSSGCTGDELSALEQDITTMQFKVTEFNKQYESLLATLELSTDAACSENPEVGQAQQKVRDQLKLMKEKTQEIRKFYQNTYKPHLQNVKQVCVQMLVSSSSKPKATEEAQ